MNSFINFQPGSKEHQQQQLKNALMAKIMGQGAPAPTNAAQGMAQGMNSLIGGFQLQNQKRGLFPNAPGGQKPGFMTGLMNMFGNNGGLY